MYTMAAALLFTRTVDATLNKTRAREAAEKPVGSSSAGAGRVPGDAAESVANAERSRAKSQISEAGRIGRYSISPGRSANPCPEPRSHRGEHDSKHANRWQQWPLARGA